MSGNSGACHVCAGNAPILTPEEVTIQYQSLRPSAKWVLAEDGKSISRVVICRNWKAAISAIEAISEIAENPEMQHHPDIHLTNYRELEVRIFTHSVGGLTEFDFKLARAIEQIPIDYSPKWLRENPQE